MLNDFGWRRRLGDFKKAFELLEDTVRLAEARPLSELERLGLVHAFECAHDKAWMVVRDWLEYQANIKVEGPLDTTREAVSRGLVSDGVWIDMVEARERALVAFDRRASDELAKAIMGRYAGALADFRVDMGKRAATFG
jgi:hypothetical protein